MRRIYADESMPPPRTVWAEFKCDGDHGLFKSPVLTIKLFSGAPKTLDAWTAARAEGWSVTPEKDLCPGCRR